MKKNINQKRSENIITSRPLSSIQQSVTKVFTHFIRKFLKNLISIKIFMYCGLYIIYIYKLYLTIQHFIYK